MINFYKNQQLFLALTLVFSSLYILDLNAQCNNSTPVEALPCGNFRTQTQGGWGSSPRGNNPGAYLQRNFAAAFPNGLVVGCNNKLVLTTAKAVGDFLPSGSTASKLPTGVLTNPGCRYSNVFAGQVVALKLSIGFDAYDANFSGSTMALKDLKVKSGAYAGVKVGEILAEAEKALGGCASLSTISQLNSVVSKINENFVDGTKNLGFLECDVVTPDPCANDTQAPVFTSVPQSFTTATSGCFNATWAAPIVTDNCTFTVTSNIASGTCLPVGVHTITYTAKDAAGNVATYSFTITVNQIIAPPVVKLGLKENMPVDAQKPLKDNQKNEGNTYVADYTAFTSAKTNKSAAISVYPNPTTNYINIDLATYQDKKVEIVLYNNAGTAVRRQSNQEGNSMIQMQVMDLPKGHYIVSIIAENEVPVAKPLVIVR